MTAEGERPKSLQELRDTIESWEISLFPVHDIARALHVPVEYLMSAHELRSIEIDPVWNPPDGDTCTRAETPAPEPPYDGSLKQRRYWKKVKEV
jgi:hypothetical protein